MADPHWFVAREGRVEPTTESSLRPAWGLGGTYTLVLSLPTERRVSVGALGPVDLPGRGVRVHWVRVGNGGFSRVDHHREVVSGERSRRHWHVDSLTGQSDVCLDAVFLAPGRDAECDVALTDGPVAEFGASDCDCRSHLGYDASTARLRQLVRRHYQRLSIE